MLDQKVSYTYDAPVRRLHHRLVIVPRPEHGPQVACQWELGVMGCQVEKDVGTDRFGNTVVALRADMVEEEIAFVLSASVDLRAPAHGMVPLGVGWPTAELLAPTHLTRPDRSVRAAAARLAAQAASPVDFAERACSWAHTSLAYQHGVTSVKTTAVEALSTGRGVCQDFAHVMLAVCRAAGVAARYVSGHLLGEGGSHAWVEVIIGPAGAVALDPTHNRRAAEGYLTVAVGRDYADVAPTSGSFSGRGRGRLLVSKRLRYEGSDRAEACS
jgi:transglutaminase-like putative cysteine protease